ncbi:MAG: hypothetical protein CL878_14540 [Dehalococcoidia bacterium]|nr:hypothetical protein [Dehalococcoidia bacterium]
MPRTGLVIFDLDGTLFRADLATVGSVRWACREFGLPTPGDADIVQFIGRPSSDFYAWLRTLCPPAMAAEFVSAVDGAERRLTAEAGRLYPEIHPVLTELRTSVGKLALCTNGRQEYVETVLRAHHLAPFFAAVRYRQTEADNKPGMVRDLLAQLHDRPAIMVGDRQMDIEAAHKNDIRAIGAAYGYGSAQELSDADALAATPTELPALVQRLLRRQK